LRMIKRNAKSDAHTLDGLGIYHRRLSTTIKTHYHHSIPLLLHYQPTRQWQVWLTTSVVLQREDGTVDEDEEGTTTRRDQPPSSLEVRHA
jgi:hypothetical protein